jgi:hypothetical protein
MRTEAREGGAENVFALPCAARHVYHFEDAIWTHLLISCLLPRMLGSNITVPTTPSPRRHQYSTCAGLH